MRAVFGVVVACALALAAPVVAAESRPVDLAKAPLSYYSLTRLKFGGVSCSVSSNWDLVLKQIGATGAELAQAKKILSQAKFGVSVDGLGVAQVASTLPQVDDPQAAAGLQQTAAGMKNILVGFFQTWSGFVIRTPFPKAGSAVDDQPTVDGRRLKYSSGADVTMDIVDGARITVFNVHAGDLDVTIRPHFAADPDGLLLDSYVADIAGKASAHVKADVVYQLLNGAKFPSSLHFEGSNAGKAFAMELALNDCRAMPASAN